MSGITLELKPCDGLTMPSGHVASFRLPLKLGHIAALHKFVELAYGPDCDCLVEPKGWLKVVKREAVKHPTPSQPVGAGSEKVQMMVCPEWSKGKCRKYGGTCDSSGEPHPRQDGCDRVGYCPACVPVES